MDSLVDRAWLRKESELEATAIGTTKTEKQKEKKPRWKTTDYPRTVGQLQKLQRACNGNSRREEGTEALFEAIMTEFPQINVRYQITDH